MTSIVRFIKEAEVGSVFDDHATKAMGEAFEAACKDLDEAGQSSVVYEAVAKRIIEIAKSGERDPNQPPSTYSGRRFYGQRLRSTRELMTSSSRTTVR